MNECNVLQNFPVIFHGVAGVDDRESSSPSFFNIAEIEKLMDYVRKLLESQGKKGRAKITPRDIGIIAPYRKQVTITSYLTISSMVYSIIIYYCSSCINACFSAYV